MSGHLHFRYFIAFQRTHGEFVVSDQEELLDLIKRYILRDGPVLMMYYIGPA